MSRNTTARRLDLLEMEGEGFSASEIVKELSVKYGVTERTVWYDFEKRREWQPQVLEMENCVEKIVNRYDQLYRKAGRLFLESESDSERLRALNLMRQLNSDLAGLLNFDLKKNRDSEVFSKDKTEGNIDFDQFNTEAFNAVVENWLEREEKRFSPKDADHL